MATNFPTNLDNFTNPTSGNTLASPDHAAQHANINDAVEALEAKVGVNSSAVTTSHDYKIAQLEGKSPTITLGGDLTGSVTLTNLGSGTLSAQVADDSHNHVISNVDGLQTALDAKQAAATALTTTTTFGGDVSGTYNAIVVADDSHNHITSNIDGLEEYIEDVVAGSLTAGSQITVTYDDVANTITLAHADTSTQASVNNSNGTVIQDVTVDGNGHVTALGSVDLDGRYYTETEADARFLRGDTSDTLSGTLTVTGGLTVDTNTLHVDATNNRVGIGTASPTVPLDVVGDVNITTASGDGYLQVLYQAIDTALYANLTASGQMDAQEVSLFAQNPNTEISVPLRLTGSTVHVVGDLNVDEDTLFVDASTNSVGIGTNAPTYTLEVDGIAKTGDLTVEVDGDDPYVRVVKTGEGTASIRKSTGYVSISALNAAESAYQDVVLAPDGGNVGIGTTSPSVSLDVSGTARFTSASVTSATASSSLLRNITLSTSAPTGGNDGDVWMVYT